MSENPIPGRDKEVSPRVDLITAAVLLAFSLSVIAISANMPTFIDKGASFFLAPGIVPSFYGTVLTLLALVLGLRAVWRGALKGQARTEAPSKLPNGESMGRLAIAVALCLVFAVGLIGSIPFWLAVAIFVTAFITIFEWQPGLEIRARIWPIGSALLQGLLTGVLVTYVFQELFLVRLP